MNTHPSHSLADGTHDPFENVESWAETTRALQRVARAIVGDAATAEDIVQNAWLLALERSRSDSNRAASAWPGLGWFRVLVQRRAIDVVRRRSWSAQGLDACSVDEAASVGDALASRLTTQRDVLDAVDALREPYRAAVYMRYFEGLGPTAIAQRLAVPPKTVQTRLTRAHHMLRESLKPTLQDEDGGWSPALLAFVGASSVRESASVSLAASTLIMKNLAVVALAAVLLVAGWIGIGSLETDRPSMTVSQGARDEQPRSALDGEAMVDVATPGEPGRLAPGTAVERRGRLAPVLGGTGSLRVRVLDSGGRPFADAHVVATVPHDSAHLRRRFRRLSDGDGFAEFTDLPVGRMRLSSDRDLDTPGPLVEISAGGTVESTIVIAAGVRVVGTVQDQDQLPIPNAGIWLTSRSERWTRGAIVTHADASGRFEIRDAPADQSIGAAAAGFLPSGLIDLDDHDTSAGMATVDITMARGGAELRGVVRSQSGAPVVGALVAVGDASGTGGRRSGGTHYEEWTARTTWTDAKGAYAIEGLRPGKHPVQVRHGAHALWSGSTHLDGGGYHVLDIALQGGVTVSGKVTTAEGDPIEGASVLVFHEPLPETYLQGGRIEYGGAFHGPAAVTDAAGDYELLAVSPGPMSLYALAPLRTPLSQGSDRPYAIAHLDLEPLVETVWNAVLDPGREIAGRTLYRNGVAIQGVYVRLESADGSEQRIAHSTDGHFRFFRLGEGPFTLRAQDWRRPDGAAIPIAEGVLPGRGAVDLVASYDAPEEYEAAAVGIRLVVEPDGWASEAAVVLEDAEDHRWLGGTRTGADWTFQVSQPGTYRPVALIAGRAIATGADFQLHPGDSVSLPDLIPGPAGTLILEIHRPNEVVATGIRAYLRRRPSKRAEFIHVDGQAQVRIEHLEPGPGRITIVGDNVSTLELPFEVSGDHETRLDVDLIAAVPVTAQVEWPPGDGTGTMSLKYIHRSTGTVTYETMLDDMTDYESPMSWTGLLPIGSYLLEVTKNGLPHYREEFEVRSLEPDLAPQPGK